MLDPARPPLCAYIPREVLDSVEEALETHGYGLADLAYYFGEALSRGNLAVPAEMAVWRCKTCNGSRLVVSGPALRAYRKVHKLTIREIGAHRGRFSASHPLISLVEQGKRPAHPWLVEKYAEACAAAILAGTGA